MLDHPVAGRQVDVELVCESAFDYGREPAETRLAPRWSLDRIARHAIDFWLSTEDLPLPGNRVTVDREGRLTLAYTPSNEVPKQKLYEKLRSILGKLRMEPYRASPTKTAGARRDVPLRHRLRRPRC